MQKTPAFIGLSIVLILTSLLPSVSAQEPLPSLQPITVENAHRLEHLMTLGQGSVKTLVWSPDNRYIALSTTHGAWLYDTITQEYPERLTLASANIVEFSADMSMLMVGETQGKVRLFDLNTRELQIVLEGHTHPVQDMDLSPDGKLLVSAGAAWNYVDTGNVFESHWTAYGDVRLWDVETGAQLRVLEDTAATGVTFLSQENSPPTDHDADIWDVGEYGLVEIEVSCCGEFRDRSVSADGIWETYPTFGDYIYLTNLKTDEKRILTLDLERYFDETAFTTVFSPDGTLLAVGGLLSYRWRAAGTWLFDPVSGEQLGMLAGQRDGVNRVAFSPDGTRLATVDRTGTLLTWDVPAALDTLATADSPDNEVTAYINAFSLGAILEQGHREAAFNIAFSPDSALLVSTGADSVYQPLGSAILWDISRGREIDSLLTAIAGSPKFSADGRMIALLETSWMPGDTDSAILWDIESDTKRTLPIRAGVSLDDVIFSPDESLLVVEQSGPEPMLYLWDIETETQIAAIEGNAPAFSPDGSLLAYHVLMITGDYPDTRIEEATIHILDIGEGETQLAVVDCRNPEFSPDGAWLACAGLDGNVHVVDTATGMEVMNLEHGEGLSEVRFKPDGTLLASIRYRPERETKLWTVTTSAEWIERTTLPVSGVFNSDWTLIATADSVWDVNNGNELVQWRATSMPINDIAFSPDGTLLASCSDTDHVYLYGIPAEEGWQYG
jgi:WD40 repeat protein